MTGSALIVHPASRRVLLRWHPRQQAWIQVGGHGDPGELDPLGIAEREAAEETGLADLAPWPDPDVRHVVVVSVPAAGLIPPTTTPTCASSWPPRLRMPSCRSGRTRRCAG